MSCQRYLIPALSRLQCRRPIASASRQMTVIMPAVQSSRMYSVAPPQNTSEEKKHGPSTALWIGAAVIAGAGAYYYYQVQNSSAMGAYKAAKEGDLSKAGERATNAILGRYPGLSTTLTHLLGKDVGQSISETLEAMEQARKTATSSNAGKKLRARAKEVEDGMRELLNDILQQKENALKELGPAAKKHFEAVKHSFSDKEESVWENLENVLQTLKKEGNAFAAEAKHSEVGDKIRGRLEELLKKAKEVKKQGEEVAKEVKK